MSYRSLRGWVAVLASLGVLLAACGSDDEVPSSEALAEQLLTVDDLAGSWDVEYSGPLTDEMRADAGAIDMCDEAESIVAPLSAGRESSGDWQADWQEAVHALDYQMVVFTGPLDRADDQTVSLIEALYAGDQAETIYTALSEGYRRCLDIPAPPEEELEAYELDLPEVGDERFGWVLRMGETDRWDVRWVIVRDGSVVIAIEEHEILSGENILSDQEIADIVGAAAGKVASAT